MTLGTRSENPCWARKAHIRLGHGHNWVCHELLSGEKDGWLAMHHRMLSLLGMSIASESVCRAREQIGACFIFETRCTRDPFTHYSSVFIPSPPPDSNFSHTPLFILLIAKQMVVLNRWRCIVGPWCIDRWHVRCNCVFVGGRGVVVLRFVRTALRRSIHCMRRACFVNWRRRNGMRGLRMALRPQLVWCGARVGSRRSLRVGLRICHCLE